METIIISSIVGIILFVIGIFFGQSSSCYHDIYHVNCGCCCDNVLCHAAHTCSRESSCLYAPSGKTLAQAEAEIEAERRGYEMGYERGLKEKLYNNSFSTTDEFMTKFSDAIKPLKDLEKEYKIKS